MRLIVGVVAGLVFATSAYVGDYNSLVAGQHQRVVRGDLLTTVASDSAATALRLWNQALGKTPR